MTAATVKWASHGGRIQKTSLRRVIKMVSCNTPSGRSGSDQERRLLIPMKYWPHYCLQPKKALVTNQKTAIVKLAKIL
jgi:hypothetical protein